MGRRYYSYLVLTIVAIIMFAAVFLIVQILNKASTEVSNDVSVALNSSKEKGYASAVPIFSIKPSGKGYICGATVIGEGIAVTAAHCIDSVLKTYVSEPPLDYYSDKNILVDDGYIRQGYPLGGDDELDITSIKNDIAIIEFTPPQGTLTKKAKVVSPKVGCNYRMVSYGTTSSEIKEGIDPNDTRQTQGIDLCITKLDSYTMYLTTEKSGICMGDSGSPIFEKGTNRVVGLISSIAFESQEQANQPCVIGNDGLAVRLDTNYKFLNKFVNIDESNFDEDPDSLLAQDDSSIAEEVYQNALERYINSVDNTEVNQYEDEELGALEKPRVEEAQDESFFEQELSTESLSDSTAQGDLNLNKNAKNQIIMVVAGAAVLVVLVLVVFLLSLSSNKSRMQVTQL